MSDLDSLQSILGEQIEGGKKKQNKYLKTENSECQCHRENGGTVPLRINPIYTLHSGYLLGISLCQ